MPFADTDQLTPFEDLLNDAVAEALATVGTFEDFTPSWGGIIGNGSITGRVCVVGDRVDFTVRIVAGSTTNFSGGGSLDLPYAKASSGRDFFKGGCRVGSSSYPVWGDASGTTTMTLRTTPTTAGAGLRTLSPTVPDTFASGDTITISGTYEKA